MNFLENTMVVSEITHALKIEYKKDDTFKMENRPWYGIAFSFSGELTYTSKQNKVRILDNQVVFLPKNSSYKITCNKSGSFAVINFLTTKDFDINLLQEKRIRDFTIIQNEFLTIYSQSSQLKLNSYESFSSLYKILSLLKQNSIITTPNSLVKAIRFIDENFSNSTISNTKIAEKIGVSEVYLRKLFKTFLNCSTGSYLQNKRMEKAKKMLIETTQSITQIALDCGFSCVYYFCNSFKKKTGLTPMQYRTNNAIALF